MFAGLCVKHWVTECSSLATCTVCKDWTNDIGSQVYDLYSVSQVSQLVVGNDLDISTIPSPGKEEYH